MPNIRSVRPGDEHDWKQLYGEYRDFYELIPSSDVVDRVWGWVTADEIEVYGLVASDDGGELIGLANFRPFRRPSSGTIGTYLDDLYVRPSARGRGAGRGLLRHLARDADDHGSSVVRWITAESNHTARRLYDDVATATRWVTYDMKPAAGFDGSPTPLGKTR